MQIRNKLSKGPPSELKDLLHLDAQVWLDSHSGLKEIRDHREVRALTHILMLVNRRKLLQAVDMICQRIREVHLAKKTGSSWVKGKLVSLLPTSQASTTAMPDGAFAL